MELVREGRGERVLPRRLGLPLASLAGTKCSAEANLLLPPAVLEESLPRDLMMSISPEKGQSPQALSSGRIQIAGQMKSPLGSWALT